MQIDGRFLGKSKYDYMREQGRADHEIIESIYKDIYKEQEARP